MSKLKKSLKIFYSMKFAIIILLLLSAVCTIASVIPQGKIEAYYLGNYSETVAKAILLFDMDKAFTSWWFVLLTALLCINLSLCSIIKFPQILNRYKTGHTLQGLSKVKDNYFIGEIKEENEEKLFKNLGFKKTDQDGNITYSVRNKIGLWGAWICHVGMLMIIIGFAAGQVVSVDETVYGVVGEVLPVPNTDFTLTIDDFKVDLRDDLTVNQYKSMLTFQNNITGEEETGVSMVNHPFEAFGYRLYQNSTGWANDITVYKNGEQIQKETICMGEALEIEGLPITIVLNKFYPDYFDDGHDHEPYSKTPFLINPITRFAIYYDQDLLDMNIVGMNEKITIDDYEVILNNPREYTLIQILRDPTLGFVAIGGLVLLLSLVISFYMQLEECLIVKEGNVSRVYARSLKGKSIFKDKVVSAINEIEGEK